MKRWIKWTATGTLLLGLVIVATATSGLYLAEQKRNRHIDIKPRPVAYTTEAQTIERGRYLYASRGCADCHGAQGTGREFVNDGKGTRIVGPNITPAGVVARYQPEDWNSVIRHGVKPNGRPLLVMPSEDYNRFTNDDLSALVSYVRQFQPRQGLEAVVDLPRPAWVLYGLGAIPDAAARIDHQLAPSRPVPAGLTVANGQYVANMCIGCHGADLSGGKIPGAPPDWPAASDLRPGKDSAMARYQPEDWNSVIRHGVKPNGRPLLVMPSEDYNRFTNDDLNALVSYVRQFKPQQGLQAVIDLPRPAWVLYGLGAIPDAAARIDHQLAPSRPVPAGVTLANGQYVANMCIGCHGADLSGGKIPGAPPDWPAAADIRPGTHSAGTALARYPNAASCVSMLRTGKRPDGTHIQVMPFESLGQLSDVDAQALYLYLNAPPGSVKQEVGSTKVGGQKSSANTVPAGPGRLKLPG